jgi:DNA mismatch repair ATPase MutS
MKAFLMYKNLDFDMNQPLAWNEQALVQDLELDTLFTAMTIGDKFLYDVAKKAVLTSIRNNPEVILYRQNILKDCLKNPTVIRNIYNIVVETIEGEKKIYWGYFSKYPIAILDRSVQVLQMYVGALKKLRNIANEFSDQFVSEGFTTLFAMLKRELGDEYFAEIQNHLQIMKFRDGVLISAELGKGNKGTNYVLRNPANLKKGWLERVFNFDKTPNYSYTIAERDDAGTRALSELRDRGINNVANALAQSCDHILSFFNMLRIELAFYIGCLNLSDQLAQMEASVCFPIPTEKEERKHTGQGIYDVCLVLTQKQKAIGNDLNADNKSLVIITGANQGGKSTFLRAIGLTQLMMQSGMFVPAEFFCANVCDNLFTHYKREEDTTMSSGKLDEELSRMNDIVNHITPNSMLLFNESFAATNEREGSEIASQITTALLEDHLKVFFVSHLYEFAHSFYEKKLENTVFLRAVRQKDGKRTYKLLKGEPLQTSYGKDLYNKITQKVKIEN